MAVKRQKPVIKLIGDLRVQGADWELAGLRDLYERLGNNVAKKGKITRIMRYSGGDGGRMEVRFFGMEADSTQHIPEGMTALELSDDSITVSKKTPTGLSVLWEDRLAWEWLDVTNPRFPVGEFTARIPEDWTSNTNRKPLDFILAANSYYEKGKAADDEVSLTGYDSTWPGKYEKMAEWLRRNIPPEILIRVEHIGSTAIPGMPAKPVIDILVEVPSLETGRKILVPIFNKPECEYWYYDDHLIFILRKELMGTRTHHIHAAPAGGFRERITFRDYLRNHPADAKKYADLKQELSGRFTNDREAYTDAKGIFIKEITEKALKHGTNKRKK